jgi:hypothetical protein
VNTVASVEVELALTHAGTFRTRAVFVAPAQISVGTAEQATLRIQDASLPTEHDFLEFADEGVRLLLLPNMALELIVDNERKSLDALKLEGCVSDEGGVSMVHFPNGANAVLTLGSVSIMMKCREASDPASHVNAAGSGELVCGSCGSDLKLVLRHPLALSSCPRCQCRNRTSFEESDESYSGKFGPDGTDADVPLTALVTSFDKGDTDTTQQAEETQEQDDPQQEEEAEDGPTDQGLSAELSGVPEDFEEEVTQPSLSLRGSDLRRGEDAREQRKKPSQLSNEMGAQDENVSSDEDVQSAAKPGSKRRRRRRKRPVEPLWTPRLFALAAVGVVSGAIGMALILYAVFAG